MGTKKRGMTLVELLVVVSIVGMLAGLIIPAVQYARNISQRSQCKSNLRQIGLAMEMYLDAQGNRGVFPDAAQLPSLTPDRPTIVEVLAPFSEGNENIFRCPADQEFFVEEGQSYEYPAFRLAGKHRAAALTDRRGKARPATAVWLMYDYESFHGPEEQVGSRNFLYFDGHVDSE